MIEFRDLLEAPSLAPLVMIVVGLIMRAAIALYYRDSDRVLRVLKLLPRASGGEPRLYKRFDPLLAPLPFLWVWLDVLAAVRVAAVVGHPLAWLAVVVWVGGRFRALQEFGHNAVHFALCAEKGWQWWLSDFFFQFPAFKRDMANRELVHKHQHHRRPNHRTADPNRARVRDAGMVPGITRRQFYYRLFYPLTPAGLWANLAASCQGSLQNRAFGTWVNRAASLAATSAALWWAGGWRGVVFGWLVPVLTTYQLFAWVALLAEHRWFVPESSARRKEQEFIAGRPTDYPGLAGSLVRLFVSPASDAYHLAHSLYPTVRWNYLPAIDRFLKTDNPNYTKHASRGLLFERDGIAAALSELRERLTKEVGDGCQA